MKCISLCLFYEEQVTRIPGSVYTHSCIALIEAINRGLTLYEWM